MSVVVPALDEEAAIEAALAGVRAGLVSGDELLVVDGGSRDRTAALARAAGALVLEAERGRGTQMNAGAAASSGDVLLFLHADTTLPALWRVELDRVLDDASVCWGRFDLEFDEGGPLLKLTAALITLRSRLMRSATGDQAIFVRRGDFEAVGGYREPRLFEDLDLVRRLRSRGAMGVPRGRVVSSSRRWRNRGTLTTILTMWWMKTRYLAGVPAARLERRYRDER